MSDVANGGDTVFVQLGIGVKPQKGSAIVWYNLQKSGQVDGRLMHAGCPILVGSKWVCTKWLRERGQEFLRPCGLNED
jgi:prolyl 4-hydroxylase